MAELVTGLNSMVASTMQTLWCVDSSLDTDSVVKNMFFKLVFL